jgi:hypothetical protein
VDIEMHVTGTWTEAQLRKFIEDFSKSALAPASVKVEVKKEGKSFLLHIKDANG